MRLFDKLPKNKFVNFAVQFIKFGLVGVINTAISLAVYYVIVYFNEDLYLVGSVVGFLVSTLNAYLLNSKFVFNDGKKNQGKNQLLRTYIAYIFGLLIQTCLMYIFVEWLFIDKNIAPILCLFITTPTNYLTNKFWVYAKKKL